MPHKILVTGGAGYIGSVLVPMLLDRGFAVTVLDRFAFEQSSLLSCCGRTGFSVVRGDCRDESTMRAALLDADAIIALAAVVGAPACDRDRPGALSTNLEAIRLLLSLRRVEQWILFPCTNSGYGIGQADKLCTEDTPLRPISLYGRTKVDAETAVLEAGNSLSLRLATVFGVSSRMRIDLLVNDFVHRAVRDRFVVVFDGDFKRNYIHVRDVARAFLHALDHFDTMKGRAYNVGLSNANLSKLELCQRIQVQIPEFVYFEAPVGEDPDKRDYIVSNARIEATGYQPLQSLDYGIAELRQAYAILRPQTCSNV